MTNTPHSVPDDCTPTLESNTLADDWNPTENGIIEETAIYDGKIIARMPDLGANGFVNVNNIERQKFPSVWKNVYQSMMTQENRQQFFKRMTAFGGAVLLCGVGILFLERSNKEPEDSTPANNVHDVVKMMPEKSIVSANDTVLYAHNESKRSSENHPESSLLSIAETGSAIPVANIADVQRSVVQSSPKADSPWNRPSGNTYSPWNVPPKQPENTSVPPAQPVPAVVVDTPVATPPPAPPAAAVEMTPMTPLSMPVSPYEQQMFVAQSAPPVRPPVDPFMQSGAQPSVQSGNSLVPGMVQTHERLENPVNTIPQNGMVPPPQPQYQQQAAPQGRQPVNIPPQGYNNGQQSQNQHGQYGQYNQYAGAPVGVATNVPAANVPPQNMPIPSGVSTLQPQEGYYTQPSGNVPAQNNNFHPNITPAYRRVY